MTYLVALIAVWSFANNDPVYTRFMYPAYAFLILSVLALLVGLRQRVQLVRPLLPLYLLGCVYVLSNLAWIVRALIRMRGQP